MGKTQPNKEAKMEYVLQTNQLTKKYGSFSALDHLTMHIPKGAIYGFVGKNGAGKTTLIRVICGLQSPTSGEYFLYGKSHSDKEIRKVRRRIGAVVETPSIYLDMTAEDNLKVQNRILGNPTEEGIRELLDLVGLKDTGKKRARHFSLGMKQRLGIALALAGSPDLLVLDEPANGLDPEGIIEIRELILRLNREKRITVLISSHILEELSKLATHYGFIHHGKMLKEISADELERSCQKCIRLTVSDMKAFCRVAEEGGKSCQVLSHREVDLYGDTDLTDLIMKLAENNCRVLSFQEHDESLENFYMNLVGGEES